VSSYYQGYGVSGNLILSSEVIDELVPGVPVAFTTARVGQNGRFTFEATAGQNLVLQTPESTFDGSVGVTVYTPNGSAVGSMSASAGSTLALTDLIAAGTYTVFLDPSRGSTGGITLLITQAGTTPPAAETVNGSVAIDSDVVSLTASSTSNYTFAGSVGQTVGLGISALTTTPSGGNISVTVLNPDNSTVLANCGTYYASNGGGSCNLAALPTTGTYTVRIVPASGYTANLNLGLSSDIASTLIYGATTVFTTSRVGQNGRYNFAATAGQDLSLSITGSTFTNNGGITILTPSGSTLTTANFSKGAANRIVLRNLIATGMYSVFVDPAGTDTGALNLQLFADVGNSLAIDSGVLAVTLAANQNSDYAFAGTAGQRLGLGVSGITSSTTGAYVNVVVIEPDGSTVLTDCGSITSAAGGSSCALATLPVTGSYIVRLTTSTGASASASLVLSSYLSGSLVPNNDPIAYSVMRVGRGAYLGFSAKQGKRYTLKWADASFSGTIGLFQPDGSFMQQGTVSAASSSGTLVLPSADNTGRYSVLITPSGLSTGGADISVTTPVAVSAITTATQYAYGKPVVMNVYVSGTNPTGNVVVSETDADNTTSTTLATAALSNGQHTFTLTLPAGTHILKAEYAGDANNEGGGYATVKVVVGGSDTTVSASANPIALGKDITYTAKVSGVSASGTVSFYDNGTQIGSATLTDGAASFTTSYAAAGSHSIVAVYAGDDKNMTSTSDALTVIAANVGTVSTTYEYDAAGRLTHVRTVSGGQ
jgi:hypothetical protein